MKFVITAALIFCCFTAFAQTGPVLYQVKPGEPIMYTLPFDARYQYPTFKTGIVQFRNGNMGGGTMNYSCLMEEMDFVTEKMDTLALSEIPEIKYVAFETDTFYRVQKFFVRQVATNGNARLAERRSLSLSNRQKYGGHGELQGGSSVVAIEQLSSDVNTLRKMVAQELLTFSLTKLYYFGDRFGNFKAANKKNLMDSYGKTYPGLENFLAQNKINYSKLEDMKLVLEFLSIDEQKKK